MNVFVFVPASCHIAGFCLRKGFSQSLNLLSKHEFICAWSAVAYLFPWLHPDGFDDPENGWPPALQRFAAEAWRRADSGELTDDELYPSDAQWAGLYDRMKTHTPQETKRRLELAVISTRCANV